MPLLEEFESQGNFLFKNRGSLPIFIVIIGMAVFVYTQYFDAGYDTWINYQSYEFICLGITLLGFFIRVYTVGHTPANTSGRNVNGQLAEVVNQTGIYSLVRHPLYVGNFFLGLGMAFLPQNLWFVASYVLFYWVYYEKIMFAEEQFLRKKFGEVYVNWASKTPAFVLSFKNWAKPAMPFSIKKVLKKEKTGFFEVFLLFFLFDTIKNFVNENGFVWENWHSYSLVASLVIYAFLKFLGRKTSILHEEGR